MAKLTARQAEILALIEDHMHQYGAPPTRAEIARVMGFASPNAAEDHLKALAKKSVIELVPGTSRGIRLKKPSGLPIVGKVAAGQPILAEEHIEQTHKVDPALFHPSADYLLRVSGDSMQEIGINDGDLLAVHATPNAEHGQVVVARVNDEVTVKRFSKHDHTVILAPENRDYQPISVDLRSQAFCIEGVAVGIIRTNVH